MVAALLAVVALAGAHHEQGLTQPAASAALASVQGDDPVAAAHASCAYRPDSRLLALEARFDCVVKTCGDFQASVEIDHTMAGQWRYRIVRAARGAIRGPRAGDTAPGPRPAHPICG